MLLVLSVRSFSFILGFYLSLLGLRGPSFLFLISITPRFLCFSEFSPLEHLIANSAVTSFYDFFCSVFFAISLPLQIYFDA